MPSPLGHALAGVAVGWLVGGRAWPVPADAFVPGRRAAAHEPVLTPGRTLTAALYAAVGIAPDLDLLVGSHSTYTHSLGATVLVFAVTLFVTRRCLPVSAVTASSRSPRFAAAVAAAWASHLLLDWLGSDTSAPIGIMALWPFTRDHYQSSLQVFDAISRRYWLPEQFIWGNLRAAAREVLILAPLVGLSYWITYANHGGTEDTETRRSS